MVTIHIYHTGTEVFTDYPFGIEDVFKHSDKPTLYVRNQEEREYYAGMQLMYGKELTILTEDDHYKILRKVLDTGYPFKELPFMFFSTYTLPFNLLSTVS